MKTIVFKELSAYFSSLAAYVTITIFLVVLGLFLWVFPESSVLEYGYAGLDSLFATIPYLFMFLIPAVSMRSLSEEKKEGTFELLATKPLTDWQIILGKFFAVLVIVLIALIPTLICYFSVYQLGNPVGNIDTGAVIGSYIGTILLAAVFAAIGVFSSSLTKNQIVAFSIAVFLCFFLFSGFGSLSQLLSLQHMALAITDLGVEEHYQSVGRGVLDTRDLIYFISVSAIFLVITRTILRSRQW